MRLGDYPRTEYEAALLAFGPNPEPECDGAGRDAFCEIMRQVKLERKQAVRDMHLTGR